MTAAGLVNSDLNAVYTVTVITINRVMAFLWWMLLSMMCLDFSMGGSGLSVALSLSYS